MEKDAAEPIIEEIIRGCNKKQPKIVAACFNVLSRSLEAFGTKIINPKPILKILPMAFQHSDKSVRDEVRCSCKGFNLILNKKILTNI